MNCERARRLAHDMGGKAGAPAAGRESGIAAELERHLWSCPPCRAYLEQLRVLRTDLRALGNRRAPDGLGPRTMSALRLQQRRRRPRRPARRYWRQALAAAVAAAAVVATGAYLATHRAEIPAGGAPLQGSIAPLVMEYTDFRAAQPFGDRDGMALIRARVEQQQQEGHR